MLTQHHLQNKIIWLVETESTNHYATALLKENAVNETAIVAAFQTKGKGQRENLWESEAGKNILMSWICYPTILKIDELFYLNKVVTKALVEFLKIQFNIDAKIKWPNDIYVGDKKIAGILIENAIQGQHIKHAIVGIGLNINQEQFSDLLSQKCISAKLITGKEYIVNEIVLHLLHYLHNSLEGLIAKRFQPLTDFYMKHLYRLNEEHYFKLNFEKVSGTIVGVNRQGKLIVLINGEFKTFANKEIEYII
ncbi:MAG: hypothetical protein RJA07_837 [Bacteroidota bacterium]|jgi:BirA family biotin operon repressor/biotin-[acetyl-CoA-carboxylase] ligase